jgi:DNA-binding GntR family transcriptional regulator
VPLDLIETRTFGARIAIETQVLTQSIRHGDLDDGVGVHHRLSQLPTLDDDESMNPQWLETHRRFHEAILGACPNPRLREVAQRLRDISEVYRCWSVLNTEHIQLRDIEHSRLATRSVMRDVAAQLMC